MLEGFQLFVKDWGPQSLVALMILFIATGMLETRWSVNKKLAFVIASKNEALERERYYRDTVDKQQITIHLQAEQLGAMLEQGKTTVALLSSIAATAGESQRGRHGSD